MKQVAMLMPHYMSEFACVGAACPANCCHGFVAVDRQTYRKYQAVTDPVLKEKLAKVLSVNKASDRTEASYAGIDNAGQRCIFLRDNLCELQRTLGDAYLSKACHTVPRKINKVNGILEISCKMLCPEAVRLALDNPQPMTFDLVEGALDDKYIIANDIPDVAADKLQPHYYAIRDLAIDLLQDRRQPFDMRMLRLGGCMSEIDSLTRRDEAVELAQLLEDFRQGFSIEIKPGPDTRDCRLAYLDLLREVLILPTINTNGPRYHQLLSQAVRGLHLEAGVTAESWAAFAGAYADYYQPFFHDHQYIYEHYFVSYIFGRVFPLRSFGTALDEYYKMVWYYLAIHCFLVGLAADNKGLSKEIGLEFITLFSTIVEFGVDLEANLLTAVKACQLNDLYSYAAFLRPGQR